MRSGATRAHKCARAAKGWLSGRHTAAAQPDRGGRTCSTNDALVVAQHNGALEVVRKRLVALLAEHGLHHREDTLTGRRSTGERKDDARRLGPIGDGRLVHLV